MESAVGVRPFKDTAPEAASGKRALWGVPGTQASRGVDALHSWDYSQGPFPGCLRSHIPHHLIPSLSLMIHIVRSFLPFFFFFLNTSCLASDHSSLLGAPRQPRAGCKGDAASQRSSSLHLALFFERATAADFQKKSLSWNSFKEHGCTYARQATKHVDGVMSWIKYNRNRIANKMIRDISAYLV